MDLRYKSTLFYLFYFIFVFIYFCLQKYACVIFYATKKHTIILIDLKLEVRCSPNETGIYRNIELAST